jgi:predicted Zn-dependent protease
MDPRLSEAEQCFRAAVGRDEGHVGAAAVLGEVKRMRGLWRAAEPLLQWACRLDPRDPRAALTLAQTLEKLGRQSEACGFYRTVEELLAVDETAVVLFTGALKSSASSAWRCTCAWPARAAAHGRMGARPRRRTDTGTQV